MSVDVNVMVGGEAGQGVQALGHMLAKALARSGFHIFADQDYESRVRGGHNFFRVRAAGVKVGAVSEDVDVLVALNRETIDLHGRKVSGGGVVLYDSDATGDTGDVGNSLGLPLKKLADRTPLKKLAANTVALGAVARLLNCDPGIAEKVVGDQFGEGEVGEGNVAAFRAGHEYVASHFPAGVQPDLRARGNGDRMLLTGNEAMALGALAAGCRFVAAYPMTPATSIMEYMASRAEDLGVVVVQPEDEIAAINMVVGAAYAGARAMTATSGGGFCLMVEGLGLAGITETPIVVVDAQRASPAIGLPTRTEQSDLEFVLHASHGEFPRAVLAPASIEDCFWAMVTAFNLADRYQLPVIVLTDQHLASSYGTADRFDLSQVTVDRGLLLSEAEAARSGDYRRHRITESGISPRALPLGGSALVVTDADEHDEEGHMIEDAETRTAMMLKRLRKLEGLRKETSDVMIHGPVEADVTLLGWGSTYGALREAVERGLQQGLEVNLVHLNELWPFPVQAVTRALENARETYTVENNATGQLARLLQCEVGQRVTGSILKFDGRPFSPAYILDRLPGREV